MPPKKKINAKTLREYTDTLSLELKLFGPAAFAERENPFNLSVERTALDTLAAGQLLKEGYSPEEIVNPQLLQEERLARKNQLAELLRQKKYDEFAVIAAEGYGKVLQSFSEYFLARVGEARTAADFLKPENRFLPIVTLLLTDAGQEIPKLQNYTPRFYSKETLDRMVDRQTNISGYFRNVTMLMENCAVILEAKQSPSDLSLTAESTVLPYAAAVESCAETLAKDPEKLARGEMGTDIQLAFGDASAAMMEAGYQDSLAEAFRDELCRQSFAEEALNGNLAKKIFRREEGRTVALPPEETKEYAETLPEARLLAAAEAIDTKTHPAFCGLNFTEEHQALFSADANPFAFSAGRSGLTSLAVLRMLKEHPEQDLDYALSDAAAEQRKKYGEQALFAYETYAKAQLEKDQDAKEKAAAFGKYAAETFYNGLELCVRYMEEKSENLKDFNDLLLPENQNVLPVVFLLTDIIQELARDGIKDQLLQLPEFDPEKFAQLSQKEQGFCFSLDGSVKAVRALRDLYLGLHDGSPGDIDSLAYDAETHVMPNLAYSETVLNAGAQNPAALQSRATASKGIAAHSVVFADLSLPPIAAQNGAPSPKALIREAVSTSEGAKKLVSQLLRPETRELIFHRGPADIDVKDFAEFFTDREGLRLRRDLEKLLTLPGENAPGPEALLKEGVLGNGSGEVYRPDPEKRQTADDVLKQAVTDLRAGKELLFFRNEPGSGKALSFRLGVQNGRLAARETKTISPVERNKVLRALEEIRAGVEATGVTRNDSPEFTAFRESCRTTEETVRGTLSAEEINRTVNRFREAADAYYMAKLGQSKNSRRLNRFNLAAKARIVENVKPEDELMRDKIAGKTVEAYCRSLIASNEEDSVRLANSILTNRKKFDLAVERLREKPAFAARYNEQNLPQLKKSFAKNGSRLVLNLLNRDLAAELFAPERAPEQPQLQH